jgi:uncharacterized repeat protein (TIGR01451 family)
MASLSGRFHTIRLGHGIGAPVSVGFLSLILVMGATTGRAHGQSVDLSQCANDDGPPNSAKNDGVIDPCDWINGSLNAQNSDYAESDGVPMRAFALFPSAGSHNFVFRYDFTKNNIYAYDFLVDVNHTMPVSLLNPCENLPSNPVISQAQCDSMWSGPDANTQNLLVVSDTFDSVGQKEHPAQRHVRLGCYPSACSNAQVTSIVHDPATNCFQNCGTSVAYVTLAFDTPSANTRVGLWFAGELAPAADPDPYNDPPSGWGTGFGAASIGGAPIDVRLVSLDGGAIGGLVNQISGVTQLIHVADLSVEKTGPAVVTQGNQITYQVTVTNNGPDSVTNVLLSDVLPPGTTFVSATPNNGATCSENNGVVSCSLGLMGPGDTVVVTIVVGTIGISPTDCGSGGGLTNLAQLTRSGNDTNPDNDSDSVCTSVVAPQVITDLSITKSDNPDPVVAGNNLTYTITVNNSVSGSNAANASWSDALPSGTTFVSLTPAAGWSCQTPAVGSGGVVSCSIANFLVNSSASFTLVVNVGPAVRGVLSNTATVTSDAQDSNPANNSDTETTQVATAVDVSVDKSGPATVTGGSQVTYSILVANDGTSTATNVDLVDTLPADATFISATASQGSGCVYLDPTITCSLGNLQPGASATVSITVGTPVVQSQSACPGAGFQNTAQATGFPETDSNSGNNSDTTCTTLNPLPPELADLDVDKTDSPDPVLAGQNITYSIVINNTSTTVAATGVSLSDPLPAGTTFVSLASPGGWSCTTPAVGGSGTVSCTGGTIAASGSASFTLVVAVDPSYPGVDNVDTAPIVEDRITNTATVGAENDPEPHQGSTDTNVDAETDLTVSKSDADPYGPDPVVEGNQLKYAITVTNNGPSDATGVIVTDTLPALLTFNAATSFGGCSAVGQVVTCTVGAIAAGQSVTIVIGATAGDVSVSTVVTNPVSVSGDQPEPAGGGASNSDSEETTINPLTVEEHDLQVGKGDSADPVTAGTELTYTITVQDVSQNLNLPDNVVVTDTLPAQVSFLSASPSGANCTHSAGVVTCSVGKLPSDPYLITINVTVNPAFRGTITNNVSVTTAETDANPDNNSASEDTLVQGRADLAIDKAGPSSAGVGNVLGYTISVSNLGPSTATGVTVTDTLPAGTTFLAAGGTNWSCSQGPVGTVTCHMPVSLAPNSTAPLITIKARVENPAGGTTLQNTATVAGTEPDPATGNNRDTVRTRVSRFPPVPAPALSGRGMLLSVLLVMGVGAFALRRLAVAR